MELNSCLMLACGLYTPVNLFSLFNPADLVEGGVVIDTHATLLYAKGLELKREELAVDIETILGDDFVDFMKDLETAVIVDDILADFELGVLGKDEDYIVLKLKPSSSMYKTLKVINKGLVSKYEIKSDFPNFIPHISLACVKKGLGKGYIEKGGLEKLLKQSSITWEDLVLSYGKTGENDYLVYSLTTFHTVDRYFRERALKYEEDELKKGKC